MTEQARIPLFAFGFAMIQAEKMSRRENYAGNTGKGACEAVF